MGEGVWNGLQIDRQGAPRDRSGSPTAGRCGVLARRLGTSRGGGYPRAAMKVQLRQIHNPDDALALAARIDRCAAEAMAEYRDEPLPPGTGLRFARGSLRAPESVFLVAESAPGEADLGLCLVGPFEDPLTGERVPMVLVLWVDPKVRRRGLAKALVAEAREILRERGLRRLAARAPHNDDALISMGERSGFTRQWELMLLEEGR